MFVPHRKHCHCLLWGWLCILYVDEFRTSQEIHLPPSALFYGNSFTFSYVDDVRTSQEALPLPVMALALLVFIFTFQFQFIKLPGKKAFEYLNEQALFILRVSLR
jgi:hypothetical protein